MVIGIGLNLRKANSIEIDLDQSIGALDQLLESRETSLDAEYVWLKLITSLEQYLHDFDLKGFSSYQEQWQLWDAYQDQAVCISGASKEPIYGIAKGVNASGALLLQQDNNIIAIHAGDVSLRVQS
jgi:BirA family biotin operon repressor/biotin-[acetyl-CoA-carboxylase] ligase